MADLSPFGLSTAWNGPRHTSLRETLAEVRQLGFGRVELYMHFTARQLDDAATLAHDQGLEITSLHSPCPVEADADGRPVAPGDWLASTDVGRRVAATDAVKRTIDTAAQLRARAIVVHLGRVEVESLQERVFEAIRDHGVNSPAHRELLERARTEREEHKLAHVEAALLTARALGEHARGTGVLVGMETRARYFQLPGLDEFGTVFEACEGLPVGYWHDAGHTERLESGGFIPRGALLERFGQRLVGMHLHDAHWDLDHLAPGQGAIDYTRLAPFGQPHVLQTLELSQSVPREQIVPGVQVLAAAGFGTNVSRPLVA